MVYVSCHDPMRTLLVKTPFSLILIDCSHSPEESKIACQRIRHMTTLPIFLLTDPVESPVLLSYLSAGANDFIVKPYRPEELTARLLALLQRSHPQPVETTSQVLRYCDLVVDVCARRVLKNGREIELSPIGFRLLVYFLNHESELISKHQLLRDVWGYEYPTGDLNMVDSAIQRLRRDLGENPKMPEFIHTVWGNGYRFDRTSRSESGSDCK